MATPTANYGFIKDAPTQLYDVTVVNANLDAIDNEIKIRATAIEALDTSTDARLDAIEARLNPAVTPSCRITTAADQSISNSVIENLDLAGGAVVESQAGMAGVSTDRITVKTAGYYIVSLKLIWDANPTGRRYALITKGPSTVIAEDSRNATTNTQSYLLHSAPIKCAVDDWFYGGVLQASGGSLATNAGCYLQATWVAGP